MCRRICMASVCASRTMCWSPADGCTVYTSAPKTVAEIEEVMRHG
jgi:hypothetical protein